MPAPAEGFVVGTQFRDAKPSTESSDLPLTDGEYTDLSNASRSLEQFGTNAEGSGSSALSFPDIRLTGYQSQTVASAPGSTVTLNLQNFTLSGHSTLTLLGDATSTFIINVTNQFSLTQSAKVLLSGGLQWDHVFFNVLGPGATVILSGKSILVGSLTASERKVRLDGSAMIYGAVAGRQVVIRQGAQIIPLPVVSP